MMQSTHIDNYIRTAIAVLLMLCVLAVPGVSFASISSDIEDAAVALGSSATDAEKNEAKFSKWKDLCIAGTGGLNTGCSDPTMYNIYCPLSVDCNADPTLATRTFQARPVTSSTSTNARVCALDGRWVLGGTTDCFEQWVDPSSASGGIVTRNMINGINAQVRPLIWIAIALALAILAAKHALQVGRGFPEIAAFVLKVGAIVMVTNNPDFLISLAGDIANVGKEFATIISSVLDDIETEYFTAAGMQGSTYYLQPMDISSCPVIADPSSADIFDRMDCILYKLFIGNASSIASGVASGGAHAQGLLATITLLIFHPVWAANILITVISMIYSIVRAIGQTIYVYISSYLVIVILTALLTFTVVGILFEFTKGMVQKQIDHIIIYAVRLPMLTAGLVIFFVILSSMVQIISGMFEQAIEQSQNAQNMRSLTPFKPDVNKIPLDHPFAKAAMLNKACNMAFPGEVNQVTSAFNIIRHNLGQTKPHMGMDVGVPYRSPIMSAAAGKVTRAQGNCSTTRGYGRYVVVDHGDICGIGYSISTLYAHLREYKVSVGDLVSKKGVVGFAGGNPYIKADTCTGSSTGTHLHFELLFCPNDNGICSFGELVKYDPQALFLEAELAKKYNVPPQTITQYIGSGGRNNTANRTNTANTGQSGWTPQGPQGRNNTGSTGQSVSITDLLYNTSRALLGVIFEDAQIDIIFLAANYDFMIMLITMLFVLNALFAALAYFVQELPNIADTVIGETSWAKIPYKLFNKGEEQVGKLNNWIRNKAQERA